MKKIAISFLIIVFINCTKNKKQNNTHLHDTINTRTNSTYLNNITLEKKDTLIRNKEKSPIKVISAVLTKNQYSDHSDIKIVFKNSGKKSIKAIKFEWHCINSFEEPANGRYFYGEGKFTERSIGLLKPGEIKKEFWEDFSTDADKITSLTAYLVVYTDGTKWHLYKQPAASK